ncbi:hypothetical protein [Frankia sp. EAN1pec]|uniref:hypothetical protein n=1 Tax=Parafrankia sp. (strain EAN1pec) TaxID=298653 RepID=UPI0002DB6EFC
MALEENPARSGGGSRPDSPVVAGGPATPGPADHAGGPAGPPPGGARPVRPVRPEGAPGMGSIFVLAFLVILVPGLVACSLLRWCGLAIGPAGLLGLLVIIVGLGFFPSVLQRLGWVRRRRGRPARNRRA